MFRDAESFAHQSETIHFSNITCLSEHTKPEPGLEAYHIVSLHSPNKPIVLGFPLREPLAFQLLNAKLSSYKLHARVPNESTAASLLESECSQIARRIDLALESL